MSDPAETHVALCQIATGPQALQVFSAVFLHLDTDCRHAFTAPEKHEQDLANPWITLWHDTAQPGTNCGHGVRAVRMFKCALVQPVNKLGTSCRHNLMAVVKYWPARVQPGYRG